MRHMLGNLSPNYFERTKRYMMLRASQQGTDLTVSGTPPLSLPNSLGKPLKAWSVDVLPKQDLNGYNAPWPAGGGKNKFDVDSMPTLTASLYYKAIYVGDGTFTASTDCPTDSSNNSQVFFLAGNVSSGASTGTNGVWNNHPITQTAVDGYVTICMRDLAGTPLNYHTQIESGSTATAWSPYSNICPIYGTDKLNLFVEESYDQSATPKAVIDVSPLGKNLLKTAGLTLGAPSDTGFSNTTKRTWTIGTYVNGITTNNYYSVRGTDIIVSDNLVQFTTSARAYGIAIPIKGLEIGQKYTLSATIVDGYIGLSFYKADGTYISGSYGSTYTATVPEETEYTLVCFQGATDGVESKFTNIQLEKNDSATSYEPYNATVYTGTIGSEGGESRDVVYEFDENLTWQTWGVNNQVQGITGFYFYRSNTPTIDWTNINVAVGTNWLPINNRIWGGGAVGYYTNNTNVNPATWYEMVGIENNVAGIEDTDTAQQAIDKFKAYLANNPLQVRFSLVTPAQFPITSPTIPTPTGSATTWATAEDGTVDGMEVTYVGKV